MGPSLPALTFATCCCLFCVPGPRGLGWPVSVKPLAQTPRVMRVAVTRWRSRAGPRRGGGPGSPATLSGAASTCPWHLSSQP